MIRHIVTLALLGLSQIAVDVHAQKDSLNLHVDKWFDGIYFGLAAGSQNIFGGSYVNNVDILAQDTRLVTDLAVGFRKEILNNRLVVGAEFQVGFMNGNLDYKDNNYSIKYKNNSQSAIGLAIGTAFSRKRNLHFFVYANETTRKFKVEVKDSFGSFRQLDEQGMLKYGIGFESHITKSLNARIYAGRLRVDFGDLTTNIDVEGTTDLMFGIVYQF